MLFIGSKNLIQKRDSSVAEFTPPKAGLPTNDIMTRETKSHVESRIEWHFLFEEKVPKDPDRRSGRNRNAAMASPAQAVDFQRRASGY